MSSLPLAHVPLTDDQEQCLHCLYTSDYESHKRRNPLRVEGTLEWFQEHGNYQHWLEEPKSSLLWVSADPGCGKSVLASYLVDKLRSKSQSELPATVCHFFFKDDNEKQNSATFALCALLHQLFTANYSLIKHAMTQFKNKGQKFAEEFQALWSIFMSAAADPECGNVICIVDGLDECEKLTQDQLIKSLVGFYSGLERQDTSVFLKFIVTSRPYTSIEKQFREPVMIRLKAEDKTNEINDDISLVIRTRVGEIASQKNLSPVVQANLEKRLIENAGRTFLWVSLILAMIEGSARVSRKALEDTIATIPSALDEVYDKILERSSDYEYARRLLHIVVAAIRPLSLKEVNVALSIKPSDRSYDDLDREPSIESTIKDLCGLFVRVVDSKVYLVHQTAMEFLVYNSNAASVGGVWKHSLDPVKSNLILANICVWYLLFTVFEAHPLILSSNQSMEVDHYTTDHALLDYAAKHWVAHIQETGMEDKPELLNSALEVLDDGSKRLLTWFQVCWIAAHPNSGCPQNVTSLTVASYFGHGAAVRRLLEKGADINARGGPYGSALNAAAYGKHQSVVKMLLNAGAIVYLFEGEYKNLLQVSGNC
jgi:hypothetical protein